MLNTLLLYLNYLPAMVNPNSLPKILWLNRVKTASCLLDDWIQFMIELLKFVYGLFFFHLSSPSKLFKIVTTLTFFYVFGSCRFACSFCLLVCLFLKIWSFSVLKSLILAFFLKKKICVQSSMFNIFLNIKALSFFDVSYSPGSCSLHSHVFWSWR